MFHKRDWTPWLYVGPALLILTIYLVYPIVGTVYYSFFDKRSEHFVGWANYKWAITAKIMHVAIRNNILWLIFFTIFVVGFGLLLAILADRVRYKSPLKSIIFLPMAISFVGAGVIWKFVYAYRPKGAPQIGLLNAIVTALGGEPVGWLVNRSINNFALIVVGIWVWTGFCIVVLSAAYKGIPRELLEAARVDGATEWQTFRHVTLPLMMPP